MMTYDKIRTIITSFVCPNGKSLELEMRPTYSPDYYRLSDNGNTLRCIRENGLPLDDYMIDKIRRIASNYNVKLESGDLVINYVESYNYFLQNAIYCLVQAIVAINTIICRIHLMSSIEKVSWKIELDELQNKVDAGIKGIPRSDGNDPEGVMANCRHICQNCGKIFYTHVVYEFCVDCDPVFWPST